MNGWSDHCNPLWITPWKFLVQFGPDQSGTTSTPVTNSTTKEESNDSDSSAYLICSTVFADPLYWKEDMKRHMEEEHGNQADLLILLFSDQVPILNQPWYKIVTSIIPVEGGKYSCTMCKNYHIIFTWGDSTVSAKPLSRYKVLSITVKRNIPPPSPYPVSSMPAALG